MDNFLFFYSKIKKPRSPKAIQHTVGWSQALVNWEVVAGRHKILLWDWVLLLSSVWLLQAS